MPGFYNTFTSGVFRHKTGPIQVEPKYFKPFSLQKQAAKPGAKSFGDVLAGALKGVNDMQMDAYRLTQKFITEPGSVDVHDVTLGTAKANLSLSITKALFDRAIRAYNEIINIR
ncbi:MAG: flagellar hook-basal body complex protein FliE [Spirochaetia bacterium]|jgi:flagellar hook-basal body complex protein FliE